MPLKVVPSRDRKLNKLIKAAIAVKYRKGQAIFRRGEEADLVYVVGEGHTRLTLPRAGSRAKRTVAIVGPGEVFGEEAVTTDVPRQYGAVAGSVCLLVPLSGSDVFKTLKGSSKTLRTVLESRDHDLVKARWLTRSSGSSSRARIADVLLDLAYRLGDDDGRRIRVPHWFTHQELADLAGVHRSTVTTTLNDWIYDGVLRQRLRPRRTLVIEKRGALRRAGSEPSRRRRPKKTAG